MSSALVNRHDRNRGEAAEPVVSVDVQLGEGGGIGRPAVGGRAFVMPW